MVFLSHHCIKLEVRRHIILVLVLSLTGFMTLGSYLLSVSLSLLICQMMELDEMIYKVPSALIFYIFFGNSFALSVAVVSHHLKKKKSMFLKFYNINIYSPIYWISTENYFAQFVILIYMLLFEIFRDYLRFYSVSSVLLNTCHF